MVVINQKFRIKMKAKISKRGRAFINDYKVAGALSDAIIQNSSEFSKRTPIHLIVPSAASSSKVHEYIFHRVNIVSLRFKKRKF